jgi:SAM-dependent methyltransferase
MNKILVTYGKDDTLCHFAVSPRRALPSDVRELGVMVYPGLTELDIDPAPSEFTEVNDGASSVWTPPTRLPTGQVLTRHLLESFIDRGFIIAWVEWHESVPQLELAIFLPPAERPGPKLTAHVSVNGDVFPLQVYQSVDVAGEKFSHLPGVAYRGFLTLSDFLDQKGDLSPLDIFVANSDGSPRFADQEFFWRGAGIGADPSPEHIYRVAGPASQNFMRLTGATWNEKLQRLYSRLTGRSIDACGPILDWGVGCARIARYFPEHLRSRVHGVDIDAFNIEWCRQNIPGIQFEVTLPTPPLPFADRHFELVYGHSVLTHLSEQDQHAWLRELARVTQPGGHCLLTVLNEVSWFIRYYPDNRTPDSVAAFLEAGFYDDGTVDVGVDSAAPGTYRNVSHTQSYVRRVWSEYLEVVSIIQNFAGMQSLVVLRRRCETAGAARHVISPGNTLSSDT